jgi:hypothetical protein
VSQPWQESFLAAADRVEKLEAAIRKHRDQRGDDRCWLDDMELYAVIGDAVSPKILELPEKSEFLGNCARYWECRQRHEDADEAVREYKDQPASAEATAVFNSIIRARPAISEESSD